MDAKGLKVPLKRFLDLLPYCKTILLLINDIFLVNGFGI